MMTVTSFIALTQGHKTGRLARINDESLAVGDGTSMYTDIERAKS